MKTNENKRDYFADRFLDLASPTSRWRSIRSLEKIQRLETDIEYVDIFELNCVQKFNAHPAVFRG